MSKILSTKEKNRRKYKKMYNSIQNKLHGPNYVWWMSLTMRKRYAFLFDYLRSKNREGFKFKHFLKSRIPNYKPNIVDTRNAKIDIINE